MDHGSVIAPVSEKFATKSLAGNAAVDPATRQLSACSGRSLQCSLLLHTYNMPYAEYCIPTYRVVTAVHAELSRRSDQHSKPVRFQMEQRGPARVL